MRSRMMNDCISVLINDEKSLWNNSENKCRYINFGNLCFILKQLMISFQQHSNGHMDVIFHFLIHLGSRKYMMYKLLLYIMFSLSFWWRYIFFLALFLFLYPLCSPLCLINVNVDVWYPHEFSRLHNLHPMYWNSLLYGLISSGENSAHFLQLMPFTILQFLFDQVRLGGERQYGKRSLPDTSAHDQQWESNQRPSDFESNTLSTTGLHAPKKICLLFPSYQHVFTALFIKDLTPLSSFISVQHIQHFICPSDIPAVSIVEYPCTILGNWPVVCEFCLNLTDILFALMIDNEYLVDSLWCIGSEIVSDLLAITITWRFWI